SDLVYYIGALCARTQLPISLASGTVTHQGPAVHLVKPRAGIVWSPTGSYSDVGVKIVNDLHLALNGPWQAKDRQPQADHKTLPAGEEPKPGLRLSPVWLYMDAGPSRRGLGGTRDTWSWIGTAVWNV